jgi:hypothetical protein
MKRLLFVAFLVGSIGLGEVTNSAADGQDTSAKATTNGFAKIENLVSDHFGAQKDFRRTDLITREDVEPLVKKLAAEGLTLKKPDDLYKRMLTRNDFLYVELYTPAGRKFMQRIASYKDGYDRLDRLSRLPRGKQTVHDLIRGPGGERMLEYMTTSAGGKALGRQLSQDPGGENFNSLTGRIYTVQNLFDYLKRQYDAQQQASK